MLPEEENNRGYRQYFVQKGVKKEADNKLLYASHCQYGKRTVAVCLAAIVVVAMAVCVIILYPTAETKPAEKAAVESLQHSEDLTGLCNVVGARQETVRDDLLRAIIGGEYGSRYGRPVYVMQVRTAERDMCGEFRIELLNHATFEEIQDGSRKFIECTWVVGRDSVGAASDYLTCWYELCEDEPVLVESYKWEAGWEF